MIIIRMFKMVFNKENSPEGWDLSARGDLSQKSDRDAGSTDGRLLELKMRISSIMKGIQSIKKRDFIY